MDTLRVFQDEVLLEQRVRFGELFDLYSSLLTEKQRTACELVLRGDLSIAELGVELGMTRQGAHDLVKRSRDFLEELERSLGLREIRGKLESLVAIIAEADLPQEFMERVSGLLGAEGESEDV
ncbi:MAG: DNA-binding protein [Synergistaceae bacterium]|nr:DNA-binding protein [Synergistaceae bacterium]